MDETATTDDPRRRGRRRGAAAIGAAALALGVAAATAGPASAGDASAGRPTPAPGWSSTPVEERCVVFWPGFGPDVMEPGDGPITFEHSGIVLEPGDGPPEHGDHERVDRVIVAPGDHAPGRGGGGRDHLRRAPRPGCDVALPEHGSQPVWRDA